MNIPAGDNNQQGHASSTQAALQIPLRLIPTEFSTEIEIVPDTQLSQQQAQNTEQTWPMSANSSQSPTNIENSNRGKPLNSDSQSSDEKDLQKPTPSPLPKPQLTASQVQVCRQIMSSEEHECRTYDSPLLVAKMPPEPCISPLKECPESSPSIVREIVDSVLDVQQVKLAKILPKPSPSKTTSASTKLVFIKNIEEKPKKAGYFQSKIVHISPIKKEDDPISIHNLLLKEVPMNKPLCVELLPGEQVLFSEDSSLMTDRGGEGKIVFTNYRLSFVHTNVKILDIPLGYIAKLQRSVETRPIVYSTIDVTLKIGTVLKFKFTTSKEISINAFKVMGKFVYCDIGEVFAFNHARAKNHTQTTKDPRELAIRNGWDIYDWLKEYKRMNLRLEGDTMPFKVVNNTEGRICVSYPQYFIIPYEVNDDTIRKCMRARSRDRIPALSYAIYMKKQAKYVCLWRSSQVKLNANTPRNLGDEQYISCLGSISKKDPKDKSKNLVIFDIRHKLNAVGMMVSSSARIPFPIENYRNAVLRTIQHESLPSLRDSYNKVVAACCLNESDKWLNLVIQSKWYDSIFALLRDSLLVAEHLQHAENVLIQCAEGYDRTAQLSALAQIMIDPYYRTIEGFSVLIEKEFVNFGHPFNIRLGFKRDKQNDERAPVLIQFLDAVHQLVRQFPLSFEFTSKYLARIAYQLYSNRYGNFLCSGQCQQVENKIYQETLSIWGELLSEANNLYINAYYINPRETDMYELRPCVSVKSFSFFRQHFFKLTSAYKDDYMLSEEAEENLDYIQVLHKEIRQQTDTLKKQNGDCQAEISRLQTELKLLQESSD